VDKVRIDIMKGRCLCVRLDRTVRSV